eukprot:6491364-Amphidinium_carterae.2
MSRGRESPHVVKGDVEEEEKGNTHLPVVQADYCFVKAEEKEETITHLTAVCDATGKVMTVRCISKGAEDVHVVRNMVAFLRSLGHERAMLRVDSEPALLALARTVLKEVPHFVLENSPRASKPSLGRVERTHAVINGLARTLKASVAFRMGLQTCSMGKRTVSCGTWADHECVSEIPWSQVCPSPATPVHGGSASVSARDDIANYEQEKNTEQHPERMGRSETQDIENLDQQEPKTLKRGRPPRELPLPYTPEWTQGCAGCEGRSSQHTAECLRNRRFLRGQMTQKDEKYLVDLSIESAEKASKRRAFLAAQQEKRKAESAENDDSGGKFVAVEASEEHVATATTSASATAGPEMNEEVEPPQTEMELEEHPIMAVESGYYPVEDTVEPIQVDTLECEVTHEHVTSAEIEALAQENPKEYAEWVAGMENELNAFKSFGCMEEYETQTALDEGLVTRSELLPMMTVATRKPQIGTKVKKKRVRAVLCGNFQEMDPTLNTYSQVPEWGHVRAALNLASRKKWSVGLQDISTVFLNSWLKKPVWAHPPTLFVRAGLVSPTCLWKFVRSVYGLTIAPADWSETRDKEMNGLEIECEGKRYKLIPSQEAPQIYQVWWMDLCVYVDDLIYLGPSPLIAALKEAIGKIWKVTDGGELEPNCDSTKSIQYLGIRIRRGPRGELQLDQKKWFGAALKRLNWEYVRPVRTLPPMPLGKLVDERGEPDHEVHKKRAQTMIGMMQWMSLRSRPDICAAASTIATIGAVAPKRACELATLVLRYVAGTLDCVLGCSSPTRSGELESEDADFVMVTHPWPQEGVAQGVDGVCSGIKDYLTMEALGRESQQSHLVRLRFVLLWTPT